MKPLTNEPVPVVTAEQIRRFHDDGYFVLEHVIPAGDLDALRLDCRRLIAERDAEMDRLGVDLLDLDHRGRRYFLAAYPTSQAAVRLLFSDLMAEVAGAILGPTVHLFNEQFVVKSAERGMSFSWHQDSGFIDYPHPRYLTCWITLDDVSDASGTVYLLPYGRAGTPRGRPPPPILNADGSGPRHLAEPLLIDGRRGR